MKFERNAGGTFANSVFLNKQNGVSLETTDLLHDSFYQFKNNKLRFLHNIFFESAENTPLTLFSLSGIYNDIQQKEWTDHFYAGSNQILDPRVNFREGIYVPVEKIKSNLNSFPSAWFQKNDFVGAFGESNWIQDWTLLSREK